jgi:hypothetical protein
VDRATIPRADGIVESSRALSASRTLVCPPGEFSRRQTRVPRVAAITLHPTGRASAQPASPSRGGRFGSGRTRNLGLKTNPGTQALEDAACLVFLENEISAFAVQHAQYPREKFVDIVRKTWRKMSQRAQELALTLSLDAAVASLVREAIAGDRPPAPVA